MGTYRRASSTILAVLSLGALVAPSVTATADEQLAREETHSTDNNPEFWFDSPEGRRSFDTQGSVLVPSLLDGDQITIDGDVVNTYNRNGELVASLKADLPEGIELKQDGEGIYAGSIHPRGKRCISNKWVSFGLNTAADALVCAPFGAATGGAGGVACGAAVGAGITAASC